MFCVGDSFCQAVAAAQVGASVVQINIGRVEDWYRNHPGVIRDPTVQVTSSTNGSSQGVW